MADKDRSESHMKFIKFNPCCFFFFILGIDFMLTLRKRLNSGLRVTLEKLRRGWNLSDDYNYFLRVHMFVTNEHLREKEKSVQDSAFHRSHSKML